MARSISQFAVGEGALPLGGVVFPSAARTATPTDISVGGELEWQGNLGGGGLIVIINVTAIGAAPSVVFTIQGKDPVSGAAYDILASAAVVAVTAAPLVLQVHPSLLAAANSKANAIVPDVWRVKPVHANGDSITYSVGAVLAPA